MAKCVLPSLKKEDLRYTFLHFIADPKRDVGQKQGQPYSDEQVATYDCIERLKGYNYVAVIDVDEYIYARNAKDHNLKTFLVCAQHFFSYFCVVLSTVELQWLEQLWDY